MQTVCAPGPRQRFLVVYNGVVGHSGNLPRDARNLNNNL